MPRQILSATPKLCPRCQSQNGPADATCAVCGLDLTGGATSQPVGTPVPSSPAQRVPAPVPVSAVAVRTLPTLSGFAASFGWTRIEGTVIHAGLQQIGTIRKEWWETAIKIVIVGTLLLVFGMTALVILIALSVLSLILSLVWSSRQQSQPGFFAGMATQVASFFVFSKIFGQKPTVPLTDYRIRDSGGTEYLVRVEGHIVQGALGTGDDVIVEGFEHHGTLFVRRGLNRRLNCVIRTRRR